MHNCKTHGPCGSLDYCTGCDLSMTDARRPVPLCDDDDCKGECLTSPRAARKPVQPRYIVLMGDITTGFKVTYGPFDESWEASEWCHHYTDGEPYIIIPLRSRSEY